MSYCHQCGKNLSDHWSPCPDCREDPKVTPRFGVRNILINGFLLIVSAVLLIILSAIFGVRDAEGFLTIVGIFFLIYALNVIAFSRKETVGDTPADDRAWIRNRLLLMNAFAIIAAGIGINSIAMNHIIFWCVLILGGLIWAIPSKK